MMKTVRSGLVLLLLGAGLPGAALLSAQTAAPAVAAVIRETIGRVEVKTPGAAEWQTAEPGQTLDQAALISTGLQSTVRIAIGNSTITVRPLTRLSLEELAAAQGGEQVRVHLRAGRIRAEVKPPPGGKVDFSVRSPTATASVRGTVFDFDGTRLTVEEGRVHLGGEAVTGTYVGTGHTSAADPERGKTSTALERVKEELAPALPVGVETVPGASAAPAGGGLSFEFAWTED
jgi:hypothetical protein